MKRVLIRIIVCVALICAGFYAGYQAHERRVFPIRHFVKRTLNELGILQETRRLLTKQSVPEIESLFGAVNITSAYYDFIGRVYSLPTSGEPSYGGIATFGDGLIFVDGLGEVWFFKNGEFLEIGFHKIPSNRDAYLERVSGLDDKATKLFAVKDILFTSLWPQYIYASSTEYDPIDDCIVLALYRAPISGSEAESIVVGEWRKIFNTVPCLKGTGKDFPSLIAAGGRIIDLSDTQILLSVGDFAGDGVSGPNLVEDPETHYGKTVKVDLETFMPEIYSSGHRNPQGLLLTQSGRIFETEHGPQGGDELNLIVKGGNYGWPFVTFGTKDGGAAWPLDDSLRDHFGYEKPVYSWVPSIAVSNLVEVPGTDLPYWNGDLLVSSLGAETLFRVKLNGISPIVIEPIYVGSRIRDIINFDGGFALQTDRESQLIIVKRKP